MLNEWSLLKIWLSATVLIGGMLFVWTFAPVLIPFGVVVLALGVWTVAIRAVASWVEKRRGGPAD